MTTQINTYGGLLTVHLDGDTTRLEFDGTHGILQIEVTANDGVIITHTDGSETLAESIDVDTGKNEVTIHGGKGYV